MESQDFQNIATSVRPKLMNLCRSFFDKQELAYDAEDAVQETLLRLWQMQDRLSDYQKPEALAMLIAKNVCIDILKLNKEQHEPLDETSNIIGNVQADQSMITHDTEQIISNALAKLPRTQQRCEPKECQWWKLLQPAMQRLAAQRRLYALQERK